MVIVISNTWFLKKNMVVAKILNLKKIQYFFTARTATMASRGMEQTGGQTSTLNSVKGVGLQSVLITTSYVPLAELILTCLEGYFPFAPKKAIGLVGIFVLFGL